MSRIFIIFLIIIFAVIAIASRGYFYSPPNDTLQGGEMIVLSTKEPTQNSKAPKVVDYKFEEFSRNLKIPWTIVFTSSDRLLVTEREGSIRIIKNGELEKEPLISFADTSHTGEEGLLGMTKDPDYQSNRFLYVVVAYSKGNNIFEKIVRLKDMDTNAIVDGIIFDNIPAAKFHDGGTIRFGPDNKLYISTGDALNKDNAQSLTSLSGKILRINSDGSIPSDNPFSGSPVWSFGHRNPEGFDWYPESRIMYETEHGPSLIDGPEGGDEVNVIEIGENYGWPKAHHDINVAGMVSPKITFTPAFAPASGMFYSGKVFPQFYGNFFFGGLKGEGIIRVIVDKDKPGTILSYQKVDGVSFGRIRDIEQGLDGYIYFTTSNRDGRGTPREGDDKIYRIVPQNKK